MFCVNISDKKEWTGSSNKSLDIIEPCYKNNYQYKNEPHSGIYHIREMNQNDQYIMLEKWALIGDKSLSQNEPRRLINLNMKMNLTAEYIIGNKWIKMINISRT